MLAILDRRLEQADELAGHVGDDFRDALDRLAAATEAATRSIADLAREAALPLLRRAADRCAARDEAYAAMEEHLAALAADPQRADRDERIAALVACPRPLAPLLSGAHARAPSPALQRAAAGDR